MRILNPDAISVSIEQLGIEPNLFKILTKEISRPNGMLLNTGPTGSGKTTTLYSFLKKIHTPEIKIITIENPIEYHLPGIVQTQADPSKGYTFLEGLRSSLRQDPDVIMVGEIRDSETASLAINAALTGHLVLSTLPTNSAAGAIPRLIDMGVEPFLIASTLNVVLAQRLVRKLCEQKTGYKISSSKMKTLLKYCDSDRILSAMKKDKIIEAKEKFSNIEFYHPKKSKTCSEGYKGRCGIFEVLPITESIKKLISKGVFSDQIQARAIKDGMRTMVEDGFVKATQGITSIEEVLRVIME
jgi:type IV pilus assembly protein PilB